MRNGDEQGAMQQLLLWIGLLETLSGIPAIIQTLKGSERMPGDFGFDPLGCGKDPNALARRQLVELKNGRLAMIAVGGMVHHYLLQNSSRPEHLKSTHSADGGVFCLASFKALDMLD